MRERYKTRWIVSVKSFETSALACGKTIHPPPGSWHTAHAYDTFTGHYGPGFGGSESVSGSAGIGFGPGGTSISYSMIVSAGIGCRIHLRTLSFVRQSRSTGQQTKTGPSAFASGPAVKSSFYPSADQLTVTADSKTR
jgi:hypothetical protein